MRGEQETLSEQIDIGIERIESDGGLGVERDAERKLLTDKTATVVERHGLQNGTDLAGTSHARADSIERQLEIDRRAVI